jgi:hypothetical protein
MSVAKARMKLCVSVVLCTTIIVKYAPLRIAMQRENKSEREERRQTQRDMRARCRGEAVKCRIVGREIVAVLMFRKITWRSV